MEKERRSSHAHSTISSSYAPAECSTLEEYREHMVLSGKHLGRIVAEFEEQMKVGLREEETHLLMIPTLVDVIPDGHETGEHYGIEIGGSMLRFVYVRLGDQRHEVDSVQMEETMVADEMRHCPAPELFDFIVGRLVDFSSAIGRDLQQGGNIAVGLCFSFPIEHHSIKSGKLLKWTKGFDNEGAVGKDPVQLLKDAFKRKSLKATVRSLVNDTVGILCATRYTNGPDANVAVIMGTGTNACYVEQTRNISKLRLKYFTRTPDMVVNIEWPGFALEEFLLVEDAQLDKESSKPGDQVFEKLTAGMYMGDIARRIMSRLAKREKWFRNCDFLEDPSRFGTVQMSAIAQDDSDSLESTALVLSDVIEINHDDIQKEVRQKAKDVCLLVTKRSAQLTAAAILGILTHIERSQRHGGSQMPRNIVAVEGRVFSKFELYRNLVHDAIRDISGDAFASKLELKLTHGGGGFGAAVLAAACYNYDKNMGHVEDSAAPPRKFPPRRRSQTDLASQAPSEASSPEDKESRSQPATSP